MIFFLICKLKSDIIHNIQTGGTQNEYDRQNEKYDKGCI